MDSSNFDLVFHRILDIPGWIFIRPSFLSNLNIIIAEQKWVDFETPVFRQLFARQEIFFIES